MRKITIIIEVEMTERYYEEDAENTIDDILDPDHKHIVLNKIDTLCDNRAVDITNVEVHEYAREKERNK